MLHRYVLILLASSSALATFTRAGETFVSAKLGKRLDAICQEHVNKGFSGAVLVARGEKTLLEKGYGLANRADETTVTPQTVFEIASLSKQFTAAAILALEDDGKLSTDDRVAHHLPFLPDNYRDITIYQLLTHTAGTPPGGAGRGLDAATAITKHLEADPAFRPEKDYAYSNVGYAILAAIVEAASDKSFEDYCRERLFGRAGLTSTSFCGKTLSQVPFAHGYSRNSDESRSPWVDPYPPSEEFGYEYRGMGGVVTNVLDLQRWIHTLQTDVVLSNASRLKFFSPHRDNYACGWEVFQFDDGMRCIGHGGSVRGFTSKLWWFPDDGGLLIVLANNDAFDYSLLNALRDTMFSLPQTVQDSKRAPHDDPPAAHRAMIEAVAGEYRWNVLPAVKLRLTEEPDSLKADLIVPPVELKTIEHPRALDAASIIFALSQGNHLPLAEGMNPSIPTDWPARVSHSIFPRQVANWGSFKSVQAVAMSPVPGKSTDWQAVWLVFEYERSRRLGMVGYRPNGRLQLLMFDVSENLHLDGGEFSPVRNHEYQCLDGGQQVTLTTRDNEVRFDEYSFGLKFDR